MSNQASYGPEESTLIRQAPLIMGLVVVAASPSGPIGLVKELFAIGKLVAETGEQGSNELVNAVVPTWRRRSIVLLVIYRAAQRTDASRLGNDQTPGRSFSSLLPGTSMAQRFEWPRDKRSRAS